MGKRSIGRLCLFKSTFSLLLLVGAVLLTGALPGQNAHAFDLNVVGSDGEAVSSYRWLVEEDATFHIDPGSTEVVASFNFHRSYMPVVAEGTSEDLSPLDRLDPEKHYFLSVLPTEGYTMGGAALAPGETGATVAVNKLPLPTAQITVFVFEDNNPINNAPNLPQERGLEGFQIIVEEAGGKYGVSGGQVSLDAFGNPLGTEYDPETGEVTELGNGIIKSDAEGVAVVKYLAPGKYGIRVDPPEGEGWRQTTTIEGTKTIDAWVRAGESRILTEFGIPLPHIFMGFVRPITPAFDYFESFFTGAGRITGEVVNFHMARPPDVAGSGIGHAFPDVLVGLNAPGGTGIYAKEAEPDGSFLFTNVPAGTYQVVLWDKYLDMIIAFRTAIIPGGELQYNQVDLGEIAVNDWFAHLRGRVFFDEDGDGFMDPDEKGIPDQAVLLRWRDGTVYQANATDANGFYAFDEIFPFFNWLVAEVDYARFKATGVTVVVDAGGPVDRMNMDFPVFGRVNPQAQASVNPNTGDSLSWTETGEVLTMPFQGFAGLTNVVDWGKSAYGPDENGGISGIVFYDITRAEDNPQFNLGEEWQPGIPRVQVNLYRDFDGDGSIDDMNGVPGIQLAETDNYPFGNFPGPEDEDRNGNGVFDLGDAVATTTTDSWDDSEPQDCPGDPTDLFYMDGKCYDGLRNWNQARPGIFDGGYAFGPDLPSGLYHVEVAPPPGYKVVKSQDRNVDFGEEYVPSIAALPPECVGEPYEVPEDLALFPGVEAPLAGEILPDCNRKEVPVVAGRNAAADFFLFTEVPIAAHFTGLITNDLGNEFGPNRINFTEKYSAPFIPVSMKDANGREVVRVYSDRYGKYDGLVPSTYTMNLGIPSGVSPAMHQVCINDPGPIEVAPGVFDVDPFFRKEFTQACYTFQFMPGSTTYLDTPVLPISAFASRETFPLDCEFPDRTPVISAVDGAEGGPYVPGPGDNILEIKSLGATEVRNPAYDPEAGTPDTIVRYYGFGGTEGTVTLGGNLLEVVEWTPDRITVTVPEGTPSGLLMVTRGDNGLSTRMGVAVTVGPVSGDVLHVFPSSDPEATPIQDAIDLAEIGALILVHAGNYSEQIVLWKDVRLQGSGAYSTVLDAVTRSGDVERWRDKVNELVDSGDIDLLPNQEVGFGIFSGLGLFPTEQAPGILVAGRIGEFKADPHARIDGFTITGAANGGGIMVNGYVNHLEISNNRIVSNQGTFGGGIRLGHPVTLFAFGGEIVDAQNEQVRIHHNQISMNGATGGGAGGGVALYNGSDFYEVTDNCICGNFTTGSGGGIGHKGLSAEGLIARNEILFNQSFHQNIENAAGGGISIEGIIPTVGLSDGSGSVRILSNRIQGNYSGAGDGGGIRLYSVNGNDVRDPFARGSWHTIDIFNNFIVNNVSGLAGGGISLQNAIQVHIVHNTIANNDSTATAGEAVRPGVMPLVGAVTTIPQPAGIASRAHNADFPFSRIGAAAMLFGSYRDFGFSNPDLANNIIWQNRSFYFDTAANDGLGGLLPLPTAPNYWDLAVLGNDGKLNPQSCILTNTAGYAASNLSADPLFAWEYFNTNAPLDVTGAIGAAAALDEGGNFIDISYGPLALAGDYHLTAPSPAIDAGSRISGDPALFQDVDGDARPVLPFSLLQPDIGADEFN